MNVKKLVLRQILKSENEELRHLHELIDDSDNAWITPELREIYKQCERRTEDIEKLIGD